MLGFVLPVTAAVLGIYDTARKVARGALIAGATWVIYRVLLRP